MKGASPPDCFRRRTVHQGEIVTKWAYRSPCPAAQHSHVEREPAFRPDCASGQDLDVGMATDLIRYDLLVQDALRGVVRNVLSEAARNGLQGDHHFFITFKTNTPGLRLSNRMRERYPDEMTIILQHQFWDLAVTDHAFEVGLSFNNVPERLLVPFAAVTSFVDPSVQFGLKFDVVTTEEPEVPEEDAPEPAPKALPGRRGLASIDGSGAKGDKSASAPESVVALKPHDIKPATPPLTPSGTKAVSSKGGKDKDKAVAPDKSAGAPEEAKVLSIDAFRKKPS